MCQESPYFKTKLHSQHHLAYFLDGKNGILYLLLVFRQFSSVLWIDIFRARCHENYQVEKISGDFNERTTQRRSSNFRPRAKEMTKGTYNYLHQSLFSCRVLFGQNKTIFKVKIVDDSRYFQTRVWF